MKKSLKIILIIVGVLVGIIILDTIQAKVFNNSPIIKITDSCSTDVGIFVSTHTIDGVIKRTIFNWEVTTLPCIATIKREKISEANLQADDTNLTNLIRFNGILYGKSYSIIDYAGDLNNSIGIIDFVIEKEYVPLLNGETNQKEFLNSTILEANEKNLILNCNNEAILFNAIEEN